MGSLPNGISRDEKMAFKSIQAAVAVAKTTGAEVPINDRPGIQRLLTRLKSVARNFGLNHRHTQVLDMLASFVQQFTSDGRPVVFASNNAMSKRASGLSVQILQRAFTHLIECGLVQRNASPNGKRYCHKTGQEIVEAYGIDLSPLLSRAQEIETAALHQEAEALRARIIRDRVSLLRGLFDDDAPEQLEIRKILRRKNPSTAMLEAFHADLCELARKGHAQQVGATTVETDDEAALPRCAQPVGVISEPALLICNAPQNDTHHQSSIQNNIESKRDKPTEVNADHAESRYEEEAGIGPEDLCDACPDAICFAQETPRSWQQLWNLACTLAPQVGIRGPLAARAADTLGPTGFAITVLCLVQRFEQIRNPAAYLTSLLSAQKPYSPARFMRSLTSRNPHQPAAA